MKKKIIIDLDVLTLAFWDKKDEAKLIEKINGALSKNELKTIRIVLPSEL